jgi:hypothetical protein
MSGIGRDQMLITERGPRSADSLAGKKVKVFTDQGFQTVIFSNPNSLVPVPCVRITSGRRTVECTADTWVEICENVLEGLDMKRWVTKRNTVKAGFLLPSRHLSIDQYLAVPVLVSHQSFLSLSNGPVRVLL